MKTSITSRLGWSLLLLLVLALLLIGEAGADVERLRAEVRAEYPHARTSFTQGLVWFEGRLFESVGQFGESALIETELATGDPLRRESLPDELFAEGLEKVGEQLFQLTWKAGEARVYALDTFEHVASHAYEGEGWGLCFDGSRLIMSDGSHGLTLRDPETFSVQGKLWVTLNGRPVTRLNELECVDGAVYANVFGTEQIVRIDPGSGEVTALIDASGLLPLMLAAGADVLNGIAYRDDNSRFLLTGKYWPRLFEVEFVPEPEEDESAPETGR